MLRRRGARCCSSRCRPGRRSRSSGSATSATSWPGSCPGWRSSCTWSTPGAEQLDQLRLADVTDGVADVDGAPRAARRDGAGAAAARRARADHDPRPRRGLRAVRRRAAAADASWASVGLIGSRAKWRRFQQPAGRRRPRRRDAIATITCPIGLPEHRRQGARRHRGRGRRRAAAPADRRSDCDRSTARPLRRARRSAHDRLDDALPRHGHGHPGRPVRATTRRRAARSSRRRRCWSTTG